MTVAWAKVDGPEGQKEESRKSATIATAGLGTGLQVVAVLFAVRVGYKLARTGESPSPVWAHQTYTCLLCGTADMVPAPLACSWKAAF